MHNVEYSWTYLHLACPFDRNMMLVEDDDYAKPYTLQNAKSRQSICKQNPIKWFTSFPKHIKWWMVINDLNETTQDEFCVRSIKRSANWGIETFISLVACRRTEEKNVEVKKERIIYNLNVFVLVPWFLPLLLYKQLSLELVQRWYFSLQEVDRQDFVHLVACLNDSIQ